MKKGPLTYERASQVLAYDPETGVLTWKVDKGRIWRGEKAGSLNNRGYWHVSVDGSRYLGHRLAWLLTHGEWPSMYIDHINCIKTDNRLRNLREANTIENARNRKMLERNKTGVKGVDIHQGKYRAVVCANGKAVLRKSYDTLEEAAAMVARAREEAHKEFCRHE
jgi:hypothetical protein